jgi:hypothetical protein
VVDVLVLLVLTVVVGLILISNFVVVFVTFPDEEPLLVPDVTVDGISIGDGILVEDDPELPEEFV